MSVKSKALFLRRRQRVRNKLRRAANNRPRLSVFRSSKHIYVQIIDDAAGRTVAAASSLDNGLRASLKNGADVAAADAVGKLIAARAKAAGIERLFKVQIVRDAPMELPAMTAWADARESRGALAGEPPRAAAPTPKAAAVPRTATGEKIGRNDPCFCGSGKKYKKCHYLKG